MKFEKQKLKMTISKLLTQKTEVVMKTLRTLMIAAMVTFVAMSYADGKAEANNKGKTTSIVEITTSIRLKPPC